MSWEADKSFVQPASLDIRVEALERGSADLPQFNGQRALLIATEAPWAWESAVDLLVLDGYRVEVASGVTGSLQAAPRADLVISDMPWQAGFLDSLRNDSAAGHLPYLQIMESPQVADRSRRQFMDNGADDCLERPLDTSTLISAVRARLRRYDALLRHAQGDSQESFEVFSGELFDAISKDLPVTDVL